MSSHSKTYLSEEHDPVQPRGSNLEEPTWSVVYEPNKEIRELGKREGRQRNIDTLDKISAKIRERHLVEGGGK